MSVLDRSDKGFAVMNAEAFGHAKGQMPQLTPGIFGVRVPACDKDILNFLSMLLPMAVSRLGSEVAECRFNIGAVQKESHHQAEDADQHRQENPFKAKP